MSDTRTVAIMSGGDWNDASVYFLDVPADLDLDKAYEAYNQWYNEVYRPQLPRRPLGEPLKIPYKTFTEWLKEIYLAEDADIEEYWGDT